MDFEPATTLTEQIADHIGGEIILGRLRSGARIQELKVAGELKVSRGSVREALLILESRHLIEIVPRRGAVVSSMESDEVACFCDVFTELQSLCFSKLAERDNPDLTVLDDALLMMQAAVLDADLAGLLEARKCFLLGALPPLKNFYLSSVLKGLVPVGQRVDHLVSAHPAFDPRDCLRYHQALFEAISNSQLDRVQELVRAYHGREKKLAAGCTDPVMRGRPNHGDAGLA